MVQLFGRLTKDATVTIFKDDRHVVHFSIALNNSYKTKSGARVKRTTYISCSYWRNKEVAGILKKGKLIEVVGQLDVNAYLDMQGNARGSITFHANNIICYGGTQHEAKLPAGDAIGVKASIETPEVEPADDLPF